MGALKEALELIRLFGLGRLIRMKKRHGEAVPLVRGFVSSSCFSVLLNVGFLEAASNGNGVVVENFAEEHGLDLHVLDSVCRYLDGAGILSRDNGRYRLSAFGERLMSEPRGLFNLLRGYEPVFHDLESILEKEKSFGKEVKTRYRYLAKGSAELGGQLPFEVLKKIIHDGKYQVVLDLGCGAAEFLVMLCSQPNLRCYGIDVNPEVVSYAKEVVQKAGLNDRIELAESDVFDVQSLAKRWPDVDLLTTNDVLHEHTEGDQSRIIELLKEMREAFPTAHLAVGEFCEQADANLKGHPTAFLEHHLFHDLTNQNVLSAERWREIFSASGYEIAYEMIFEMIGHGYFLLRPANSG